VARLLSTGSPAPTPPWPDLAHAALGREPFPESPRFGFRGIALQLTLGFPLLEALLHGVLRQAFGRWGAVPFVAGTAFLAPFFFMDRGMSFAAFGGAAVTGVFAARTASLVPALAFWSAVLAAQALTLPMR
jgi:hypothetical protein